MLKIECKFNFLISKTYIYGTLKMGVLYLYGKFRSLIVDKNYCNEDSRKWFDTADNCILND